MSLCAGMRREQKSDLVFYMIDETPEIVRAKRGAASGQLFGGIGSLFCRTLGVVQQPGQWQHLLLHQRSRLKIYDKAL